MDYNYKKSGTIFNMHSFWTKQPIEPIMNLIEKYCPKGGVVFDPFCGTGMTGVSAILTGREVVLNDISSLSLHIAKGYCSNFNVRENESEIANLKNEILSGLEHYYQTNCVKCKKINKIRFCIIGEVWKNNTSNELERRGEMMLKQLEGVRFNKKNVFESFELLKICYLCSCSKEKQYKTPDSNDFKLFETSEYLKYQYPTDDFFGQEPKRNYKRGIRKVYQMYSKRNLTTLSIIKKRIELIKDPKLKQLFCFVFSSILFNSSLMSRYRSYENTSIKMGTFYIPPLIKDTNVLDNFSNKLSTIIKGNALIFENNKGETEPRFLMESADEIKSLPNNSIDYIYTDPPYADIISYSELNIVYESWLNLKGNNIKEMIVSKYSKKTIENFSERFEIFLKRSKELLKNNGYLTLVFHTPNIEYWRHIQSAIHNSELEPIIVKTPDRLISKSKTSSQHKTKKNSQSFLLFTFKKSITYRQIPLVKLNASDFEKYIDKIKVEARKKGYHSSSDLYDFIINRLLFTTEIQNFKV